ncbi:Penicillin-binding protein E [Chryseobacterium nakagawai]|uniref:Serine hydrolase n=1 Tax=Chryseobacterium nakagawai TaxID=1241982 RepID=A0AAD0YPY1_CHRNA|nr:serine hydrolase [Chryseobacterium nakagawai]AZA92924.1 serine hydrolase [Chryseobacterium nakagawai]VEH19544.1 Penicillin-binding protein E [Chryseobacterium nakagawai]
MEKQAITFIITMLSTLIFAQTQEQKLEQLMQAYSATGKLNGSVLITQKGKTLLNKGYGLRDVAENLPNDPNVIFQIGSVTKQFTATVILKLQEQKQLNILDKISMYFPDYPNGDKIRIEHLLTHSSGIFNYTDDREFMQSKAMKPITQTDMINTFKNKPLKFVPGSDFEYSNSNYILLGYIIEMITNKPYEKAVDQMIFNPLKMRSSGFDFNKLQKATKAKGYIVYAKENSKESDEFDATVSYAAGGMYTTTSDLNKWLTELSFGKVISKESYKKMIMPYKNKYGYGNYINNFEGKTLVAHGGLTFGYTSYVGRIIEDDLNIIILNNIPNYTINDIANDILAILYNKPYKLPEILKEVTVNSEILKSYIGTYQIAPQVVVSITIENEQLFGQATGQAKILLTAKNEESFFIKGANVLIDFKKDTSGKITGLILTDGGKAIPAQKIN